jgi:hypothetical protein
MPARLTPLSAAPPAQAAHNATPMVEAAARLTGRPPAVVLEVVAALDEWAGERRRQRKPRAEWRRLVGLAAALGPCHAPPARTTAREGHTGKGRSQALISSPK